MVTDRNPLPVPHLHERSQNRHIRTGVDSDRETQVPKHVNLYWQILILVVSTNSSEEAPMSRLNFKSTFTKFFGIRLGLILRGLREHFSPRLGDFLVPNIVCGSVRLHEGT
jgi:hypothetical protein